MKNHGRTPGVGVLVHFAGAVVEHLEPHLFALASNRLSGRRAAIFGRCPSSRFVAIAAAEPRDSPAANVAAPETEPEHMGRDCGRS